MATWSKKTYQMVADKLKRERYNYIAGIERGRESQLLISILGQEFASEFARDNPLFDRDRFLKACGVGE